jgi:hypothetical protein
VRRGTGRIEKGTVALAVVRLGLLLSGCLILVLSFACRAIPKAIPGSLHLPPIVTEVRYFTGSPLSGPVPLSRDLSGPQEALQIRAHLVALEQLPGDVFEPLSAHTRLITASRGGMTVLPTAQLTLGTRFGSVDDVESFLACMEWGEFGRSVSIAGLMGVLPPGVTLTVRTREKYARLHSAHGEPLREGLEIQLFGGEDRGVQVVLVLEDRERKDAGKGSAKGASPVMHREVVMLDSIPVAARRGLAILVPWPFEESEARAVAVVLEMDSPPAPGGPGAKEHAEVYARCIRDLKRRMSPERERSHRTPHRRAMPPGFMRALEALPLPEKRRGALIFLAGATKARLAEHVALSAPDSLLSRMAECITADWQNAPAGERVALGWLLERAVLSHLAGMLEKDELTPALEGILVERTGEVGRRASLIEEIVANVRSLKELAGQLVEENLAFLEDNLPAARMRAYDWLAARKQAPAGYDPLAPVRARRAALSRAALKKAKAAERGDSP